MKLTNEEREFVKKSSQECANAIETSILFALENVEVNDSKLPPDKHKELVINVMNLVVGLMNNYSKSFVEEFKGQGEQIVKEAIAKGAKL